MAYSPKRKLPGFAYKVAILCATLMWGLGFVVMKDTVDSITPAWLLCLRFMASSVILGLAVIPRVIKHFNKHYLIRGFIIGALLYLGYLTQTIGLTGTTPGKNAFITAVYCVIVPFAWWVIAERKPSVFNIIAAVMCIVGLGFVSLDGNLAMSEGDAWTLVCAFFFAIHIVYVAKFSPGRDMYVLTVWQFFFAGVLAALTGLISEPIPDIMHMSVGFWNNMFYLVMLATLAALLIQNVALSHIPPAQASLFLSTESVFGVLASVLLYGEELTLKLIVGFALIFIGIVVSENGPMWAARRKGEAIKTPEEPVDTGEVYEPDATADMAQRAAYVLQNNASAEEDAQRAVSTSQEEAASGEAADMPQRAAYVVQNSLAAQEEDACLANETSENRGAQKEVDLAQRVAFMIDSDKEEKDDQ